MSVTVTTTTTGVEVNVNNGIPVFYSVMEVERLEQDADFTYEFTDDFMVDKIVIQCRDAAGATVSAERLVGTGDVMMSQTLSEFEWTSVSLDIFPADSEDGDETTIYFKTDGAIKVIIYKRKL